MVIFISYPCCAGSADLFPPDFFADGLVDFGLPELTHVAAFFVVGDLVGEAFAEPI
jgi:hypothetical protein